MNIGEISTREVKDREREKDEIFFQEGAGALEEAKLAKFRDSCSFFYLKYHTVLIIFCTAAVYYML